MNLPFVISIPHCSARVPADILGTMSLTPFEIEASVDVGALEVFGTLPAREIIKAEWNRLVIDLNRPVTEGDARGIIARIDYDGRNVYRPAFVPGIQERNRRISLYYRPYHQRLQRALRTGGVAGLFDCHSMNGIGPREAPDRGETRKDIVLGNDGDSRGNARPGAGPPTCPPETFRHIVHLLEQRRFSVSMNRPYAGGFITRWYGRRLARDGRFAVQIEINQELVVFPGTHRPDPSRVREVQGRFRSAFEDIAQFLLTGHAPS